MTRDEAEKVVMCMAEAGFPECQVGSHADGFTVHWPVRFRSTALLTAVHRALRLVGLQTPCLGCYLDYWATSGLAGANERCTHDLAEVSR